MLSARLLPLLVIASLVFPATVATAEDSSVAASSCVTPDDPAEPPCNPHLAQSPWASNHRNSYAQASSPHPGPTGPAAEVDVDHAALTSVPIVLTFSEPYVDGKRVVWASTVGATGEVFKLDPETMTFIDHHIPQIEEGAGPADVSVSGAYNVLDRDNHLIVGQVDRLEVYGDAIPGNRLSSIAVLRRFVLPPTALCGEDKLVGITMTWDGHVAFATENGVVGVVPRQPHAMTKENLRLLRLNGDDCAGGPSGEVETVSNSIATDEHGRIFVVTSHAMYGIDWNGATLTTAWRAEYGGAGGTGGGRLGAGSGSTPTLMGSGDDRFVVITDGQELMHVVLMWRDEVPDGWQPIAPGKDPRIACEVPVTFGQQDVDASLSEQSVLARGNQAFVVNNLMALDRVVSQLPPRAGPLAQLISGLPGNEPRGLERFDWDPQSRSCSSVWANPDIAIPNGIPTLSTASGLIYGVGARNGVWTLEGIDIETGQVQLTVPSAALPMENSFYAATTVGPDNAVWSGTFGGVTRWQQCDGPEDQPCTGLDPVRAATGSLDTNDLPRHLLGYPNELPVERSCFWLVPDDPAAVNAAYPDTGAGYWGGVLTIPPGSHVELRGRYPHARYFSLHAYDPLLRPTAALADVELRPDEDSTNPFVVGADRTVEQRNWTVQVVAEDLPADPADRAPNTLYLGAAGSGVLLHRVYVPDLGRSRTGDAGLPDVTVVTPGGEVAIDDDACALLSAKAPSGLHDAVVSQEGLVLAGLTQPSATDPLTWEKFFNLPFAQAQRLDNTPVQPLQDVVPSEESGGYLSNLHNAYIFAAADRGHGDVLVLEGKAPTFPRTTTADVMGSGQVRYWSICMNDANTTRYIACVNDEDVPLDANGRYTVVVSSPSNRPANATLDCGVVWLPWGPTQTALPILRHMLPSPDFANAVQRASASEELPAVLGEYLPVGTYADVEAVEEHGCATSAAGVAGDVDGRAPSGPLPTTGAGIGWAALGLSSLAGLAARRRRA